MAKGPRIYKHLLPVASLLFGVVALAHALDPVLDSPAARLYDALSPRNQNIWNGVVVLLASFAFLLHLLR